MIITPEKGWLKKQLDQAEQEIASWPKWMQTDIETQYQELRKHIDHSNFWDETEIWLSDKLEADAVVKS